MRITKHNSTNKAILLISFHSFEGVDSVDWSQKLPNISDYDIIILDTVSIFTLGLFDFGGKQIGRRIESNLHLVMKKLMEILEFNVTVYALYTTDIKSVTEDKTYDIHADAWCPISISTVDETGKTILVKNEAYEEYFKDFKGWRYHFDIDSLRTDAFQAAYESKWKVDVELNVIATNKVNKPIAVEFVPLFHRWENAEHSSWQHMPTTIGGSLVLLPVIDAFHTEPHIEVLLRQIKGFEETPPPSWVSSIEIPGEVPLKDEIAVEKQSLEAVESKVKGLEDSLTELEKYKGLLYETGLPLQELVKSTLEKLGAEIKPSIVTDEFIIGIGGKEALIEVKGLTRSISKDDLGQLIVDKGEHLKATGEDIKGILIGNAWRLLPLEQRGARNKPIFPHNIVKIARNQDIGLISTTELLKAFCKTLEEPQYKKEVLNRIIAGKGVITF